MKCPSSEDLHPRSGGRFVLVREDDAQALTYSVDVYLPHRRHLRATLHFDENGHAQLEPTLADPWAHDETLKLARVLRKNPKARLTRWRG